MRLVGVLLVVLFLAGCTAAKPAVHSPRPKPSVAAAYQPTAEQVTDYLAVVRVIPPLESASDAQLTKLAEQSCDTTKLAVGLKPGVAGVTDQIERMDSAGSGLTDSQNALFVVVSIKVFCPQYNSDIPSQYLN